MSAGSNTSTTGTWTGLSLASGQSVFAARVGNGEPVDYRLPSNTAAVFGAEDDRQDRQLEYVHAGAVHDLNHCLHQQWAECCQWATVIRRGGRGCG